MKKLGLLLLVAAACGKSDKSASPPPVTIDVAGVNAAVPAELTDKLVFEQQDIVEERGRSKDVYSMAAPKGWTQDMKGFASVKPPREPDLGFMTSLQVGSNCDGRCEPKDWAKVSEDVLFKQFRDGGTVVKDELKDTSHLMVAEKGNSTYVVYAWWAKGAKNYFSCYATLEAPVKAAAPAFEKACQAVQVKKHD